MGAETAKVILHSGVQNLGVELAGGVLSRPVSPKLAHEAVLAKPPYFMLNDYLKSPDDCPKCVENVTGDW